MRSLIRFKISHTALQKQELDGQVRSNITIKCPDYFSKLNLMLFRLSTGFVGLVVLLFAIETARVFVRGFLEIL